jgi:antitoxin HicB
MNLIWRDDENANTNNVMNKNKHRGSNLRDLLREDGVLEEVEARAVKRALALQLGRLAAEQSLSKSEMAARMKTSRAAVDRLLDASNPSMTLTTLGKAAHALGRKVRIEFVPA